MNADLRGSEPLLFYSRCRFDIPFYPRESAARSLFYWRFLAIRGRQIHLVAEEIQK